MKRIATLIVIAAFAAVPAAAQPPDAAGPRANDWEIQIFASPGWNGLRTSAEDAITATVGQQATPPTEISGSRLSSDFGWGAGARLSRGDWGLEAAYRHLRSKDLTPAYLLEDTGAYDRVAATLGLDSAEEVTPTPTTLLPGSDEAPPTLSYSNGDLFFGQVYRDLRLGAATSLSIGLGGGYLRVTDRTTDDLLARDWDDPGLPDEFSDWFEVETAFEASRSSFVYGGSLALTRKMGRFLVRPRLDVVLPLRRLTTAFDYEVTVSLPETDAAETVSGNYTTSVRPVLFLASVEIGFGR